VCGGASCITDNQACGAGGTCCSGNCTGGVCQPLTTACKTAGNTCSANTQCCSKLCSKGQCVLGASFCIQTNDACVRPGDCCSGICVIGTGKTVGTCSAPPSGASNCSGGVDGAVCNGCGDCCSRLCAPYGPTGVKICQPANGCHVNGDLCRKDSDCCGAAGTGLPGAGTVTCDIQSGQKLGICRNPSGGGGQSACNPEGNVCHFQDYACSISSSRANCCGGLGSNGGVCKLDRLGVPRCYGLGTCRQPGETCAFTGDCCNDNACVPDASGVLRCGGTTCVAEGGGCTISGDCCRGTSCIVPTGSTKGVCGVVSPPPPPPPADGGTSADGGSPPDAGAATDTGGAPDLAPPPPPPACSEYGQGCSVTADCCNAVPCTSGFCVYPIQ
jgi:hypothetical protein